MSAHTNEHAFGEPPEQEHDDMNAHGTLKGYLTGFVLAVILTVIPFWLVMGNVFESSSTAGIVILALGAVQIVVHVIYFLHMNTTSENGWNFLALIFTLILVVITLAGSIWVMYHLNQNMMPSMMPPSLQNQR